MRTLWLTYAWRDNEDQNIDHVIGALVNDQMNVNYDRIQLVAGRRLWDQIDRAITDPENCHGWAIYATRNSLESEPCQEELAYALDKALRQRGDFPLIGIFPEPLDRSLIPSALATRLFVDLRDPEWANRVRDAVLGTRTLRGAANVSPYLIRCYDAPGELILEIRPRSGRWYPFHVLVRAEERELLRQAVVAPHGQIPGPTITSAAEATVTHNNVEWRGIRINHAIDNLQAVFLYFTRRPSQIEFGQIPDAMYGLQAR